MSIAGRATPLVDGIEKVTGRARYTADLQLSSFVGEILRSPHAHAEIVRIDTSRARALEGVRAVLTGDDCAILPRRKNTRSPLGYNADLSPPFVARKIHIITTPTHTMMRIPRS